MFQEKSDVKPHRPSVDFEQQRSLLLVHCTESLEQEPEPSLCCVCGTGDGDALASNCNAKMCGFSRPRMIENHCKITAKFASL